VGEDSAEGGVVVVVAVAADVVAVVGDVDSGGRSASIDGLT